LPPKTFESEASSGVFLHRCSLPIELVDSESACSQP